MKRSFRIGFSFGLTTGIITTLGLMVGLHSSTYDKIAVIGGILIIAIADSLSESMGIHISLETENHLSNKAIWEATVYTLANKFIFSSIFIIPVLLFELTTAIIISIMIGLYLIFVLSIVIARSRNEPPLRVVIEHLAISVVVIILTHFIGQWIHYTFGCL